MEIVKDWGLEIGSRVACFYGTRNEKATIGVVVHITNSGMVDVLIPENEKPIRFSKQGEEWGASDFWRPFIKPLTPELETEALRQKVAQLMEITSKNHVKTMGRERLEMFIELLEWEK